MNAQMNYKELNTMMDEERRIEDVKIAQLTSMVQTDHGKINEITKILASTPDPETLRNMEHVIKELPSTDDLKDCVKARTARSAMFKKVAWGVMGTVFGTLALAVMAMVWQGIHIALAGGVK